MMKRLVLFFGVICALSAQEKSRFDLKQVTVPYKSADGRTVWELKAEKATGDREKGTLRLFQVKLETRERGILRMQIQADSARILDKLSKLELSGNVIARLMPSGAKIRAQQGAWDWRRKNYLCWDGVTMQMKTGTITGYKVEGNSLDGSYTVR